ncbi:Transcriptional regulator, AraC-family [Corynebacterium glyciniphilum AJ 3170]|uniref:HTH-type transcriptional regulator RipA n=2 Tax=Corynebacterium TaxID=1716 RepID=X5EA46_9CORY|nr:Transcriptional regulator, AraC-family [Corynebacterium glyciniphilum AJ 3170]
MSEYGLRDGECIWVENFAVEGELVFEPHSHLKAQLVWADRGQIAVIVAERRWILAPSQALWIPAEEVHDIRTSDGTELFCAYLWEEECETGWEGLTVLSMSPLARELLRHLAREDLEDAAARHARATLLSVLTPADAAGVDLPMPNDPRARAVASAVLEAPGATHALDDWARQLHASERTIQRAFLSDTGLTFSAWRTQVRLCRSLALLADRVPVSSVAARMGYSSTNGFTSAFRRHFGTTPANYFEG